MKQWYLITAVMTAAMLSGCGAAEYQNKTTAVLETEVVAESRVLIAYFTCLDNTEAELEEILQGGGPYGPLGDTLEGENLDAVTSAGSGFSAAIDTLGTLLTGASIVEDGFQVCMGSVADAEPEVISWLENLGF